MASQLLFWMLRAPHGHAKNFSLQLLAGPGRFRLMPIGQNRQYLAHGIQRRHFNSTAKAVGYGVNAEPLLRDFIDRVPAIVEQVRAELPAGFSEKVADKIQGGVLAAAHALERMAPD